MERHVIGRGLLAGVRFGALAQQAVEAEPGDLLAQRRRHLRGEGEQARVRRAGAQVLDELLEQHVGQPRLQERDVELPFWYPEETDGYDLVDNRRAVAQGLTFQPLSRTVRDVHAWVAEDPEGRRPDALPPEREAELLRELRPRLV